MEDGGEIFLFDFDFFSFCFRFSFLSSFSEPRRFLLCSRRTCIIFFSSSSASLSISIGESMTDHQKQERNLMMMESHLNHADPQRRGTWRNDANLCPQFISEDHQHKRRVRGFRTKKRHVKKSAGSEDSCITQRNPCNQTKLGIEVRNLRSDETDEGRRDLFPESESNPRQRL